MRSFIGIMLVSLISPELNIMAGHHNCRRPNGSYNQADG
jgi:hypothetical protein